MSVYVLPPTPQTIEGFADKIGNAWKAVLSESPRDNVGNNSQVTTHAVFPALSLRASYKRPWLDVRCSIQEELKGHAGVIPQPRRRAPAFSERHQDRGNKSFSEPPPIKGSSTSGGMSGRIGGRDRKRDGSRSTLAPVGGEPQERMGGAEGSVDSDMSESSLSAGDVDTSKGRGRGPNASSSASYAFAASEVSPMQLHAGRTRYRTSAQSGTFSPGGQHAESTKPGAVTGDRHTAKTVEAKRVRMMATSKSESHIATAGLQPSVRLPKVESDADFNKNNCPKRRGRKRDLRLPPPGGHQNAASNGVMKEMETQIADLRSSPRARRALESRVVRHLSRRSKRYERSDDRRTNGPGDSPEGGACCDDSFATTSAGAGERWGDADDENSSGGCRKERSAGGGSNAGQERRRAGHASRKGLKQAQGKLMLKSGKAPETPGVGTRTVAQALRAQAVLRRKRAIEEERSKQARVRSAMMEDQSRGPRDKKAERKRAEALITIVACAIGFAEWKLRYEEKRAARLKAEQEELAARALQRVWRMNRIRRTLALVRASAPAVRSIVFSMRSKAAAARKVVARRHQTQAADLIRAALRAGTRTLFRTRISYYRERIVKCQRLCTSYREITKARKRALTNKWTRHVHKLDERRFSMYSAHLRDMYNFDPVAVEGFLKEMRLLAARGQTAAQAMKSKPFPEFAGIGSNKNNKHNRNKCKETGSTTASASEDELHDDNRRQEGREPKKATKSEAYPVGDAQPRGAARPKRAGHHAATPTGAAAFVGSAPKRAKVKLAAGWQKRVVHVHSDVQAQASLMSRRGVKHKEISRALRNVLTKDLLDCARREHRNWCWNYVRAIREKERQNAVVNLTDIRSVLRTDSLSTEEGTLEAKIKALTTQDNSTLPFNRQEHMHLMTMITDDLLMRCIILAERIEGCVAADGSGCGSLSPEELKEIFVVNRHPNQPENAAAKEARAELQAWAKGRGIALPNVRRGSTSKVGSYHLQQKALKDQHAEKALQVPYFDFMSAVKGGILSDICVPEGQRLALRDQPHSMPVPRAPRRRVE